jgi:hypothetical protein
MERNLTQAQWMGAEKQQQDCDEGEEDRSRDRVDSRL